MKSLIASFILFNILISCNYQKSKEMLKNEKLVEKYFEHFNKHNFEEMANMYVENADFKDPSLGQGIVKQTKQQTIKKYTDLVQMFPDLKDRVIQTYPSGDKNIIVEFISTGTGPDGVKFELAICTIFTIENDLIIKDFTYYDNFEE